jgi:hypothetical protein
VTIHNELYQPPEEFISDPTSPSQENDAHLEDIENRLTEDTVLKLESIERPLSAPSTLRPLLQRLPRQLPELKSLPLMSFKADKVSSQQAESESREFAREFSISTGGCHEIPAKLAEDKSSYTVKDMFCLSDE